MRFLVAKMSYDGNQTQTHTTLTARNICTCAVFLILAFQPILFHVIVGEGHYMPCSMEEFIQEQSHLTVV